MVRDEIRPGVHHREHVAWLDHGELSVRGDDVVWVTEWTEHAVQTGRPAHAHPVDDEQLVIFVGQWQRHVPPAIGNRVARPAITGLHAEHFEKQGLRAARKRAAGLENQSQPLLRRA